MPGNCKGGFSEVFLFACSTDSRSDEGVDFGQSQPVVVASCSPKTHERYLWTPAGCGLESYLLEMSNIGTSVPGSIQVNPKWHPKSKGLIICMLRIAKQEPIVHNGSVLPWLWSLGGGRRIDGALQLRIRDSKRILSNKAIRAASIGQSSDPEGFDPADISGSSRQNIKFQYT
jgi:hypothetical protein